MRTTRSGATKIIPLDLLPEYRGQPVCLSVCLSVCEHITAPPHIKTWGLEPVPPAEAQGASLARDLGGGVAPPLESWSINAFCVMVTAHVMYFRF